MGNNTTGETNVPVSDWTTGTLKILQDQTIADVKELLESEICAVRKTIKESDRRYEQRFDGQQNATNVALQSAKEAVIKAENATEKRFESVNEFRSALNDQSKDMLTRTEYDSNHTALSEKTDALTARIAAIEGTKLGNTEQRAEGRQSQAAIIAQVSFGVMIFLGLLTVIGFVVARSG